MGSPVLRKPEQRRRLVRGAASSSSRPSIRRLKSPSSKNGTPSSRRCAIQPCSGATCRRSVSQVRPVLLSRASWQPDFRCTFSSRNRPREIERDVGAAAQAELRQWLNVERDQIGVLPHLDPAPHGEADPLHHLVAGSSRACSGRAGTPRGRRVRPVHLLQRHDVGVQRQRIAPQQGAIFRAASGMSSGGSAGSPAGRGVSHSMFQVAIFSSARPSRPRGRRRSSRAGIGSQQGGLRGFARILRDPASCVQLAAPHASR